MSTTPRNRDLPAPQGLYDPRFEHDACGLNFVCDLKGRPSHDIVAYGIGALCALEHRGASGAEVNTGDGAGILIQVPDAYYRDVVDFDLSPAGTYLTGIAFLPQHEVAAKAAKVEIERLAADEGLVVLGWREVITDASSLGNEAISTMPQFKQVFITTADQKATGRDLDRLGYILRKRIEHEISVPAGPDEVNEAMGGQSELHDGVYFPSLSSRTIIYKGMLTTPQLAAFYPELTDTRVESALALVHSRFSTNTFPSWPLAHPYRFVAHNGEINTVQGNRNWMAARESLLASDDFGGKLDRVFPVCTPGASDTASFDEALELLYMGGYSLQEAMLMMIPEPWENHESMSPERKAFYRYHAALMEPWDGPASIAFTDGEGIGAVLDRNGLRPSRYWVTEDDLVIMASEVGVVDIDQAKVIEKGRLQPGRMFFIDTTQGRIIRDDEIKAGLEKARPYQEWLDKNLVDIADLPRRTIPRVTENSVTQLQQVFGYTHEEVKMLIAPMGRDGKEAIGSMGTDTPIAVLSDRPRLLFDYFKQLFAQVTNPPLDAMREELVTSVFTKLGAEGNLFDPGPASCRQVFLPHPVITPDELDRLIGIDHADGISDMSTRVITTLYPVAEGGAGLANAVEAIRAEAAAAVADGATIIVLSDRGVTKELAPVPSLLATAAVHHHLIAERTRTRVGLVADAGDAREVHHLGLLLGFGASAVCPYVAYQTIDQLIADPSSGFPANIDTQAAYKNYVKATDKGILKIMSKMGISTVASYTGAQIFEALGLNADVVDEYFRGAVTRLGGVSLDVLADEVASRHALAFPTVASQRAHRSLEVGGEYQWRREGEYHLFNPETVFKLQHATREGRMDVFREYTQRVNDQAERLATLRGLFTFNSQRPPVPLDEVEPASEIIKRFATGAMSYGSISAEAHETLAIAMNRIGGKSNTGEGGEDPARFTPDENGDLRRSSIKQVASGRFGVTANYLTNADDIQIKMAQGAKPGEGGQLPAHKVWPWIAEVRHSTPGVGLISPPPHHDIYSIEDLAQLIHDLKNANPAARVHVKLVAELGVGTVAAGVSKAHADAVLISGFDGGTGASPLTSIKHAGAPWEIGLAETQQTLMLNGLRDRISVQVDGQLKTGRDVVIAALLGGDEFGFATAPLVVMGCVMMRVCHLDTCPVGVATQDPELRKRFTGEPEFVENFFEFIALEVRELLAELGFRSIEEAIGQADVLDTSNAEAHWKASGLDLSPILYSPPVAEGSYRYQKFTQDHGLDKALDVKLIELSASAIENRDPVTIDLAISNQNRTVGTMLGHEVTKKWGAEGLPPGTIQANFTGSAGNSFGAFVPRGISLRLSGDANDYVGKGLSGGHIVVAPPENTHPDFVAHDNVIAGNVILYGATGGTAFLRGLVGERFCVRNSGATAVVEGIGDHGCEYMTGGRAVILGETGRNFGAGMSGGIAYVYDPEGKLAGRLNDEMVEIEQPTEADEEFLHDLITQHQKLTGSEVAARILEAWPVTQAAAFAKVMPRDYRRVLEAMEQAAADGTDEIEAVMAAARS